MGLNLAPQFRVIANSQDITAKVRERLKHLKLTDETGVTSDTLEICLADHNPHAPVQIPSTGAELQVFLGYDGSARRMGLFIVDEIELSGFPGQMTIRARAAPYETTKQGRVDLQSQKTRSWKAGTTLGQLVRRIAGEHRMAPSVSASLARIALPHTDQTNESDMNLLRRLAERYDAVAKPAGGHLLFLRRGDAQSVTGAALARVTLTPSDGGDYTVNITSRDSPGTVIAYYRDISQAERHAVAVGEGEPVRRLRMAYRDKASAESAASAELRRRARGERNLSYTCPGRPEVIAECLVVMRGFRVGVDGEWLVTRAVHYVGSGGYSCTIEAEQPSSAPRVQEVSSSEIDDQVQSHERSRANQSSRQN